ncbi:hypothetical protein MASR1M107_28540 [Ignavibacteriales bacterium]
MKDYNILYRSIGNRGSHRGLKISLLGDLAFNGSVNKYSFDKVINSQIFGEICNSFLVANLETPIYQTGNQFNPLKPKNGLHFAERETTKSLLKKLNIKAVNLANNHVFDLLDDGLHQTITLLKELDIDYFGAGFEDSELEPKIIEINGCLVAFLGYCDSSTNPNIPQNVEGRLNIFQKERVEKDINKVRGKVDLIICSLHWGVDYSFYPTAVQRNIGRELIENGVDVIWGHHTHTVQPIENYKEGIICYSLGGIIFGDYISKGNLKALPKKTKKGIICILDLVQGTLKAHGTIDRKGNSVSLTSVNLRYKNDFRLKVLNISLKYPMLKRLIKIKESFFDRILEYFCGYYNNPLTRLTKLRNLKKIGILFRDYKEINKRDKL